MSRHIFCDEAGSTGANLLDPQQPVFTYAAAAIEPADAENVVSRLRALHRPRGDELKGARLVTSSPGRRLVTDLLRECASVAKVSVWNKRFTLATQFFEHVFEPVLARQNSLFYRIGFHQFISNLLYVSFVADTPRARHTMEAFQRIVRARGSEPLEGLFHSGGTLLPSSDELHDLETFFRCHLDTIAREIDTGGSSDSIYKWTIDATLSAIWSLLAAWGDSIHPDSMIVTCDASKPLFDVRDKFDLMLGRRDRPRLDFPSGSHSPVYNLAEALRFGTSHDHPGIQIADVIASAACHAFRNLDESYSKEWIRLLGDGLQVIAPDVRWIDLSTPEGAVNAIVLKELVKRSVRRDDLFDGMSEFIQAAFVSFPGYLERLQSDNR